MNYIMYSAVSAENISEYLGKPEYSYYFVLKKYIPVFEKLGDVIVVHSFVAIEEMLTEFGDGESVVICCAPPNKSYINSRNKSGKTAIDAAKLHKHDEIVSLLQQHGAKLSPIKKPAKQNNLASIKQIQKIRAGQGGKDQAFEKDLGFYLRN